MNEFLALLFTATALNDDCFTNALVQSQSQDYFTTGGLPPVCSSWRQAFCDSRHSNFIFQLNACGYSSCVTSSLTRGRVCHLQLLLMLASAVILRSEFRGTEDNILFSQIRDSPNLEGHAPVYISPRKRVAWLYPQVLDSLFVSSYDTQSKSKSKSCYDRRSVGQSVLE
jgi:hypothetical protein